MDLAQVAVLLGSFVALVGLLRAHHVVVAEYVVPNIEPDDEDEE